MTIKYSCISRTSLPRDPFDSGTPGYAGIVGTSGGGCGGANGGGCGSANGNDGADGQSGAGGRGLAVICTSHQSGELEMISDRLLLLHRGRAVFDGPPGEVFGGKFESYENIDDILYSLGGGI